METKIEDAQSEIDTLLANVQALLITASVLDSTDHATSQKAHATEARAIVNYLMVIKDGSHGAHNFNYAKALLTNTKEALEAMK